MKTDFDTIIVGGGLSGLTLACLLGQSGISAACIDAAEPKNKAADLRTTAISFGSRKILERAGVWQHIKEACPIKDIQILDGDSPILLEFCATEIDDKDFGWIVENDHLKAALFKTLNTLKTVKHLAPETVTEFDTQDTHASVSLQSGKTLTAQLMIGADGRASKTRTYMEQQGDVVTRRWSYNQRAVICMVEHENPHNNIAVEHFWPEGPFAILPFMDDKKGRHRSSVVFTEHGHEKNSLIHLSDEDFEMLLNARFPQNYGEVKLANKRAAYPLSLNHADRYTAKRMALVADAAHGIHPIAGQGLNLGFRDLDTLSELLASAHAQGKDLGSADILKSYEQIRRPDNMAMVAMTDGLNRLFSNNLPPVSLLRRTGLKLVSRFAPAKKFFMKQAMGDR